MKLILMILMVSSGAQAGIDYSCQNDCLAQGTQYGLCQKRCSYEDNAWSQPAQQQFKQTDYQCVNACTAKGRMYNYCKQQCEY